jgi:hypothetical protein
VLLACQRRDQPAQSRDPDPRGPLGALLGCHEPLQCLLLEAALAGQIFDDGRVLQSPLRVAVAQYRDLRSLRAAHVSGRRERREFPASLAELTAQPQHSGRRRLRSAVGIGELQQLTAVLPSQLGSPSFQPGEFPRRAASGSQQEPGSAAGSSRGVRRCAIGR